MLNISTTKLSYFLLPTHDVLRNKLFVFGTFPVRVKNSSTSSIYVLANKLKINIIWRTLSPTVNGRPPDIAAHKCKSPEGKQNEKPTELECKIQFSISSISRMPRSFSLHYSEYRATGTRQWFRPDGLCPMMLQSNKQSLLWASYHITPCDKQ